MVSANKITVYNPAGIEFVEKRMNFAPRPDNLDGKRIGLFWNSKANGNFFLNRVAELLEKKFTGIEIIKFWETDPVNTGHPDKKSDAALDYMAKSADLVIASQGD
jgi:hypothetical protein